MVLAYTTNSKNAATIAASGAAFDPPGSVPAVAEDWFTQLMQQELRSAVPIPFSIRAAIAPI
jgi:hypothetical protein